MAEGLPWLSEASLFFFNDLACFFQLDKITENFGREGRLRLDNSLRRLLLAESADLGFFRVLLRPRMTLDSRRTAQVPSKLPIAMLPASVIMDTERATNALMLTLKLDFDPYGDEGFSQIQEDLFSSKVLPSSARAAEP